MTYKGMFFRYHAVLRMRERGFRRGDVRWLLAKGVPAEADQVSNEHRLARQGYIDKREAKVVYVENAQRIEIVTVMWIE